MITLSLEDINNNYEIHLKLIDRFISKERADKIKAMLNDLEEIYVTSPASTKSWYHGAYPGGYLVHVNTVVQYALRQLSLFRDLGGEVDFTTEELVFSALFHDLGKIGFKDNPNYLVQDNDWFVKNRGENFKNNPDLDFMLIPDRSIFLLQKYGITMDQKEFLAIKLHDGLFEETNKPYYVSFNPDSTLKSNIASILHVADYLASKVELSREKNLNQN